MGGQYFSLSYWSNYCWPQKKTDLEQAEALFKKAFSSPLYTMYTYIGRVEGTIAPALLIFLAYVIATEEKLHDEPGQHKSEIGLLSFDALYLSIETSIVCSEAYDKCTGSKANREKLYKYLGRFGGLLSYYMIYLLKEALQNEEKDVWDNPDKHPFEFMVITAEMVMLGLGNLAFNLDVLSNLYKYMTHKKPKNNTTLPTDLHRDVNAALDKLKAASLYHGGFVNTYGELHDTGQALKRQKDAEHLAHFIEHFLEETGYHAHTSKADEEWPLLSAVRSTLQ